MNRKDREFIARELVKVAKDLVARKRTAASEYAVITITPNQIMFKISEVGSSDVLASGTEPYRNNPLKAIGYVIDLVKKYNVDDVEILTR